MLTLLPEHCHPLGFLHFVLQFRPSLAVLPVPAILAIPVCLLAITAAVAIGATATAELAIVALHTKQMSSSSSPPRIAEHVFWGERAPPAAAPQQRGNNACWLATE